MVSVRSGTRRRASTTARISRSKRLTGTRRPTATTSGVGGALAARREAGVDARRHDLDVAGREADLEHLLLGRLREREIGCGGRSAARRAARGCRPAPPGSAAASCCHISACTWCRTTTCGPGGPERREERHAVPDLDQAVAAAVPAQRISLTGGAGEDDVAARPCGSPGSRRGVPCSGGPGPHEVRIVHLDAGLGPQPGDRRGVDLGAAGLGVVEVAPGEQVDACSPAAAAMSPSLARHGGLRRLRVASKGFTGRLRGAGVLCRSRHGTPPSGHGHVRSPRGSPRCTPR